ncbi:PDGLE domain-containing protein [uncultured Methanomethylovorans sp.]|mgnify:FL=1|uniref:PDGLE domain-containing protein n=1 Tax=uncultured Methanomethylovorans sp. TaxID=183759 RepID=UPI00262F09A9|nr:PDGLE domain-containing protein [uncultured Methanomethylovorans sp.]
MSSNVAASGRSNMKFLYAGIVIALILAVLAPFLASPDPDGLESAAGAVVSEEKLAEMEEAGSVFSSPMPDYGIEGMGKSGEVAAIVAGTLLVLGISYGLGKIIKK